MQPRLLTLVGDSNNSILHTPTELVTFPLSTDDEQLIADMVYSIHPTQLSAANAPWSSAGGMAANQWGHARRIFLYCPDGNPDTVQVIINPTYRILSNTTSAHNDTSATTPSSDIQSAWEGCFSLPSAFGLVERTLHIEVEYQDQSGEHHTRTLHGNDARTWMHENDHVDGYLYNKPKYGRCSEFRQFATREEATAFGDQQLKQQ